MDRPQRGQIFIEPLIDTNIRPRGGRIHTVNIIFYKHFPLRRKTLAEHAILSVCFFRTCSETKMFLSKVTDNNNYNNCYYLT